MSYWNSEYIHGMVGFMFYETCALVTETGIKIQNYYLAWMVPHEKKSIFYSMAESSWVYMVCVQLIILYGRGVTNPIVTFCIWQCNTRAIIENYGQSHFSIIQPVTWYPTSGKNKWPVLNNNKWTSTKWKLQGLICDQ